MCWGQRLLLGAWVVLLAASEAVSQTAAAPPGLRTRIRRTTGGRWEEGRLVGLTTTTLVFIRSSDDLRDTLALRDVAAVEVSSRMKTSGLRTLGGLLVGAVAGGLGGLTVVAALGSGAARGSLEELSGAFIGAVIGGFLGLIVGQNPVPVWVRLDLPTVADSTRSP